MSLRLSRAPSSQANNLHPPLRVKEDKAALWPSDPKPFMILTLA